MAEKLKTIGFILLLFLFLPIVVGGRIPHSIGEFLIGWVGIVVFIILVLFFLSINGHKENYKKNNEHFHSEYQYSDNKIISTIDESTNDIAISSSIHNAMIEPIASKKVNRKADIVSTKDNILTREQVFALLKVAIDFCYCSPERLYLWKGQYEILLEFAETLKLGEEQLNLCLQEKEEILCKATVDDENIFTYYDIVKTIHQDKPFIQFIKTCIKLLDFLDSLEDDILKTEYYAYMVFPIILKDIGFTQKEIDAINYGEGVYKCKYENKTVPLKASKECSKLIKENYPVSKEQMAIFKKNWTLSHFRREIGIENRVESRENHTYSESYKVCIFIRNSDGNEFTVGFSNSLGELSIEEIQRREKELMIGLSDYGNYKLYDNKIVPYNELSIDLGI